MTENNVRKAILDFLEEQYLKKSEPDRKKLEKATDPNEIAILKQNIQQLKEKYSLNNWIDYVANTYANQLKFGTHISKGLHSSSKGDDILFQSSTQLKNKFVGSQTISQLKIDATGNGNAPPIASFFNIVINKEKQIKLKDLLIRDDHLLEQCFSDNKDLSEQYKKIFQGALKRSLNKPTTDERNKQLLWVNNENSIVNDEYTCLIPLYPSAFTNAVYTKINQFRYSEENKAAREKRYKNKKDDIQQPYISINDLSTVKLGGTKPQNVSQLTSSQSGYNYLLPSLPPIGTEYTTIKISPSQTSIFNNRLAFDCKEPLNELYSIIKKQKNTYEIRRSISEALDNIIQILLFQVKNLQQRKAGWTKDYQLNWSEKYWLDPNRWQENEHHYEIYRRKDWINDIEEQFALWINYCLKKRFPKLEHKFGKHEYEIWRKQFKRVLHLTLRN